MCFLERPWWATQSESFINTWEPRGARTGNIRNFRSCERHCGNSIIWQPRFQRLPLRVSCWTDRRRMHLNWTFSLITTACSDVGWHWSHLSLKTLAKAVSYLLASIWGDALTSVGAACTFLSLFTKKVSLSLKKPATPWQYLHLWQNGLTFPQCHSSLGERSERHCRNSYTHVWKNNDSVTKRAIVKVKRVENFRFAWTVCAL